MIPSVRRLVGLKETHSCSYWYSCQLSRLHQAFLKCNSVELEENITQKSNGLGICQGHECYPLDYASFWVKEALTIIRCSAYRFTRPLMTLRRQLQGKITASIQTGGSKKRVNSQNSSFNNCRLIRKVEEKLSWHLIALLFITKLAIVLFETM